MLFNNDKEKNMADNKQEFPNLNSVEEQIRSLRQQAESGELGEELEGVSGGLAKSGDHIDGTAHIDGTVHVDGPSNQ
jgi:hypothetical protein